MTTVRISIDKAAGAAYIQLSEKKIVRTIEVNDSCFVDVDELDCVVGVELLSLNAAPLSAIVSKAHVRSEDHDALAQALNVIPQYTMASGSLTARAQVKASPKGNVPA